jgi:hypothetical protein
MTDDRFNELINGPLSHPIHPLFMLRLAQALRAVVAATGAAGDAALEAHCKERELMDRVKGGEYADCDDASAASVARRACGESDPV